MRSYLTITKDHGRVMSRVKAIYRSWAIPCTGKQVYAPRHRVEWLGKISEAGVRRRAEFYYQQLDALRALRQEVRRDLLAESKKHQACGKLALRDPVDWYDPGGRVAWRSAHPAPFPNQAAAMDVQRIVHRDTKQRRSP